MHSIVKRSRLGASSSDLDRLVLDGLRLASAVASPAFLFLAVLYWLTDPEGARLTDSSLAALSAVVFALVYVALRRRPPRPALAHPLAALLAFFVIGTGVTRLVLSGDPKQTANLILVLVGVGAFLHSLRWLLIVLGVGVGSWIGVAVLSWTHEWVFWAVALATATALSVLVMSSRLHAIRSKEEARARFTALVERGADLISVLGPDGTILYESPSSERILGWTSDELVGRSVFEFVHAEDVERIVATTAALMETPGASVTTSARFRHKDGPWRILETIGTNLLHDPAVGGIVLNSRDVTEPRKIEVKVRETSERLSAVVEASPVAIVALDPEGRVTTWNPAAERIFGWTEEEALGRLVPWVQEEAIEEFRAFRDRALRGEAFTVERTRRRRDGSPIEIRLGMAPLRDADRRVVGIMSAAEDVTGRKRAEEALQRAEERYRVIVEELPGVFYIEEPDLYRTRYVSPQVEILLGVTAEEYVDDPSWWDRHLHPDDADRMRERVRSIVYGSESGDLVEYRIVRDDGRTVWIQDRSRMLFDGDGSPSSLHGMMLDVTKVKEAQEALRETEERYRSLTEQIPAVLYIDPLDEKQPDIFVSPQIEEIFGVSRDVYLADASWWERHLHPADRERMLGSYRRIVGGEEEPSEFAEYRIIRDDGKVVWIEDRSRVLADAEDRPFALQGLMFDVTTKKRAETFREGQRSVLELIAAGAPIDGVLEGLVRLIEEQSDELRCSILLVAEDGTLRVGAAPGLPAEYWRLVDGANVDSDEPPCAAAARSGGPVITTDVATDPAWEKSRELASRHGIRACWSVPISGTDGAALGVVSSFLRKARGPRIEELELVEAASSLAAIAIQRRRNEEALREAEARFRLLVEQMPAVTYISQPDEVGGMIYASPQVERWFGYTQQEWLADPDLWVEVLHPDDRDRVATESVRCNTTGEPFRADYRVVARDGHVIWIRDESDLARDAYGRPAFWLGVMYDVTDRREAEGILRQSESDLQRSLETLRRTDEERRRMLDALIEEQERERERVAEGIEDEHIQQMTALGMRLESLRRAIDDPEQLAALEWLGDTVEGAVGRLRGLLVQLRPRELQTGGLGAALDRYIETVASETGFLFTVDDRLREEPPEGIRAAAFRIAQDAIRNTAQHARAGRVEILIDPRDEGVFVRVVDDGVGFVVGDGEHRGIASMRQRAELGGGWLRVRSSPGAGTTIEFWLPTRTGETLP